MKPSISICIAARNEQDKIGDALKSARACDWCDELLVMDTGSDDRTPQIAESHSARLVRSEWIDYTESKKQMAQMARNDWVFILDADEQISPALAREISDLEAKAFDQCSVMTMPRRNHVMGRHVRAWDPDRQSRLFDRRRVHWPKRVLHDTRHPTDGGIHDLQSPLLHNARHSDWSEYFNGPRYDARVNAMAREMYESGKRVGLAGLWLRPLFAFVKHYLFKGGFLDGTFGLLIAQKSAASTQLKYARLYHLQMQAAQEGNR